MDIYLQDLGHRRQAVLLQRRYLSLGTLPTGQQSAGIALATTQAAAARKVPPLGRLGRFWARGADTPPEVAAAFLDLVRRPARGFVIGSMVVGSLYGGVTAVGLITSGEYAFGAVIAGLGAVMSGTGLWVPGYWLRRVCRPPVSAAEVEALRDSTTDELELAYLRLVMDAMKQGVAPDAAGRVRAALRAVGDAIDLLPAVALPRAGVDALRTEAAQAQAEARAETDAVVAASHERRAEALERSASAAQRSQTLMRRAAALRGEMLAQIESLRLGLVGFETASGDVSSLASLADAVRTVAEESVSVADARTELDAALPGTAAEGAALRMGLGA